ncbi:MAG: hypothetical protein V1900_04210 [Candidatus Aenigmatarchaeota archaeon]
MKGQWFLISAVIISGFLLAISVLLRGYYEVDTSEIAMVNEDYYFSNIKNNLNRLLEESSCDDASKNLDGFIHFSKQRLAGIGYYLFVNRTVSCVTSFYDSFEVVNSLWNFGSRWSYSSRRAIHGSYSAEAEGPITDSSLTMANPINIKNATLKFSWFIEDTLTSSDYLCLDFYSGSWSEYKCLVGDTTENVWLNETISLNTTNGFLLRFRAKLQAANRHVNVDNVTINYPSAVFGILLASDRATVYENVDPKNVTNLTI